MVPSGGEISFIAAHTKTLFKDGQPTPESQKIIWDLIRHCTQPRVGLLILFEDPC